MLHQRKLATIVLASACGCFSLLPHVGCDKLTSSSAQADRRTDEAITKALASPDAQSAQAALKQAVAEAADSPAAKARASAALAQAEYQRGAELIRSISEREIEADGLVFEIGQLGASLGTSNALIKGYKNYDPQQVKQEIAARVAEAQGGANQTVWLKEIGATLPTVSAADAGDLPP
jgi:hypothetical protein